MALVAGRNRVPYPAAGKRHFLIVVIVFPLAVMSLAQSTAIQILETLDIVFSEVTTHLDFDDLNRFGPLIAQPVLAALGNER
jgi:hypothetical protein